MSQQVRVIVVVLIVIIALAAAGFMGYKSFGPKAVAKDTGPVTTEGATGQGGAQAEGVSSSTGGDVPPPPGWTPPSGRK